MFGKDKTVFEPKWYIIICIAALGSFARSIRDSATGYGIGGEAVSPPPPYPVALTCIDLAKLPSAPGTRCAAVATRRGPHHGLTLAGGGAGSGHAYGSVTRRERSRGRL